ncbi:predicted protein [Uncinocarpus reesii 1704]|uniref:Uncharacterized protein n=1 Tax=Uncinocarpus reesii (strain UAMH 1704) TaxID=336963 RepID=C4JXC9_UNCRE|nr:uncharacterized protein UREG_06302 [Uncinocarpus reesii 1704]EEP81437.1 predicted protein [Uncinocarpus reesii 1704]
MRQFSWTAALAALFSLGSVEGSMPAIPIPQETPIGLMAAVGMSPRPTDPPGVPAGFPRELVPRQRRSSLPFPPPGYYCGLVDGDTDNLLTCVNARANCVHQGTAIGCCISSEISECTNIPSSCINYGESCDDACKRNRRILKCTTTTEPYCGTYFFGGGSQLFGCRSYASVTSQVQQLRDYYASALGSDFTTLPAASNILPSANPNGPPSPNTSEDPMPTFPGFPESSTNPNSPGTTPSPPPPQQPPSGGDGDDGDDGGDGGNKKSKLSGGAIGGIVVGACAGVGALAAFLVWFFCVKKKRDENNGNAAPVAHPPVMHGPPPPGPHDAYGHQPNPAAGYYAPVPQDNKPLDGTQPPSYGYDKPPQPNMAEMPAPGGLQPQPPMQPQGQAADYYNQRTSMGPPSPLSAGGTSPGSPNGMHPTHTGPVPEQIYEMGSGR